MVVISSFREPESAIKLHLPNVEVVLDKKSFSTGNLYVTENSLSWQKQDQTLGFCLNYYHITLHAVSNDTNVHSKGCIYILTDTHIRMPGDTEPEVVNDNVNESDDDESEADVSELLLIPNSENDTLNSIYSAITECQVLNPDPVDDDDDDDNNDEDSIFADANEMEDDSEVIINGGGDHAMNNLSSRMEHHSVDGNNVENNEDDEFQDAD